MSRTRHHVTPKQAAKRRALRAACRQIEAAWKCTYSHWRSWRPRRARHDRRLARVQVASFRQHMLGLEGEEWWARIGDLAPWLPSSRRRRAA